MLGIGKWGGVGQGGVGEGLDLMTGRSRAARGWARVLHGEWLLRRCGVLGMMKMF